MEKLKSRNIPAKLNKHIGGKTVFAKADEHEIKCVGCLIASAVTARYYKGIAADNDNLVIVWRHRW